MTQIQYETYFLKLETNWSINKQMAVPTYNPEQVHPILIYV